VLSSVIVLFSVWLLLPAVSLTYTKYLYCSFRLFIVKFPTLHVVEMPQALVSNRLGVLVHVRSFSTSMS